MKDKEKDKSPHKWIISVAISTFILSLLFSYISNTAISNLNLIPSILVLLLSILIGIIFDILGVSVTIASEEDFHAKASKKIKGSKTGIKLIRNSSKVANFCCDVIGDICGVISGAISAMIALKLTETLGMSQSFQFIVSALVASLTVSGKAASKEFAKNNSTNIVSFLTNFINFE